MRQNGKRGTRPVRARARRAAAMSEQEGVAEIEHLIRREWATASLGFVLQDPGGTRHRLRWLKDLAHTIEERQVETQTLSRKRVTPNAEWERQVLSRLQTRLGEFRRVEQVRLQLARIAFTGFKLNAESSTVKPGRYFPTLNPWRAGFRGRGCTLGDVCRGLTREEIRAAIEEGAYWLGVAQRTPVEVEAEFERLFGSAQAVAETWARFCWLEYERTRNPIFPWFAYRVCRKLGQPAPEWVRNYLDGVSRKLQEFCLSPPRDPVRAFFRALGAERRGAGSVFRAFQKTLREFMLARRVQERLQLGNKECFACEDVGKPFNLGAEAVRLAYHRYKRFLH